jgi:hypothetical protein
MAVRAWSIGTMLSGAWASISARRYARAMCGLTLLPRGCHLRRWVDDVEYLIYPFSVDRVLGKPIGPTWLGHLGRSRAHDLSQGVVAEP